MVIIRFEILMIMKNVCDYRGLKTDCLLLRKVPAVRNRLACTEDYLWS